MVDALSGTYADLKFIKTRSVAQLVIEVPIENANDVVSLLGVPTPGSEVWVAVARLNRSAGHADTAVASQPGALRQHDGSPKSEGERAVQRAGMLPSNETFRLWLGRIKGNDARVDKAYAEQYIRDFCGVKSRREIGSSPEARAKLDHLLADFDQAAGRMAEVR